MNQAPQRKPFVAPDLKEEASLQGVTLVSGGGTGGPAMAPTGNEGRNLA